MPLNILCSRGMVQVNAKNIWMIIGEGVQYLWKLEI